MVMLRHNLVLFWVLTGAATTLTAETGRIDFNFQIRPLLSDRCFKCHGPDERARKQKLRLDLGEGLFKDLDGGLAIVKPGDTNRSELIRRVFSSNPEEQMPPPDSKLRLTPGERELLARWVAGGAEFKPHWSLIPPQATAPPTPGDAGWVKNSIDAFVLARLEKEGLSPAPEATRETLLRRLSLDLTGLPPSLEELEGFLADSAPDAYRRAVERYLTSPAYGERMAMDWLDLARYADTYGYQSDVTYDMSPWRDWVIRSFNDNLPYDQFLLWQIAGDRLPQATRDQRLATAFNRLHRQTNEGGSVEEEFRVDYVSDRVNTVGTAMLGLTLGCAKCHDHKYDPIQQRDYYAFSAFFNSIDESGLYSHFTRATPTPAMPLWTDQQSAALAALEAKLSAAEGRLNNLESDAQMAFQSWLTSGGAFSPPQPIAHFAFDTVERNGTPDSVTATNYARLEDDPKLVAGHEGHALQFNGDNAVVCATVPNFKRTDTFSLSLWLKPAETQDRAVVLHQSRAWSDSGSRGFELVLDHGRPFFGLIHFWPGNAIAVRARGALPTNQWSHVAVAYDGSSRAAGIQLYLNGTPVETETIRDHLYKDIVHRQGWGDAEAGNIHLTLAGRFRDTGFKNGAIDDLQVFDTCLTAPEARWLATAQVPPLSTEYYVARHSPEYRSELAELRSLRDQLNDLVNDVPEIMVMEEMRHPRPTFLLQRGAYDAPGDPVERDTPASVMPFPKDQPRDRLGLARWMIDRHHPLTARVVVNRIWRMHFGRGLVATEQDFGSQGKLPTHPELLDWLAVWFMDHAWDVKGLHRLIVNSAAYRQTSLASRELLDRDPDNGLLARGPKHRLQAEMIRDSALAASGLLDRTIGGRSVRPYQPEGLWEQAGTGATYTQDHGAKLYRRSLYTFWKRTAPPPAMLTFDAVTREVCTANRETTTTPLQALVLLNDPQFVEAGRALAEKLLKKYADNPAARARDAFLSLTGRAPDEREAAILGRLLAEQREFYTHDPAAAAALLAIGESKGDPSLPRADFAATALLVSAVMNLDEFVMER